MLRPSLARAPSARALSAVLASIAPTASGCARGAPPGEAPVDAPAPAVVATIPPASGAPEAPAASGAPATPSSDPDHPPVTADERGVDEELGAVRADRPGCDGACAGTATPELATAIAQLARRTRHCYNVALIGDPSLAGRLTVRVRVGPDGDVCSARVEGDTLGSRSVAYCVEHTFREETGLPRPRGCGEVIVPLRFAQPKPSNKP